MFNCNLVARQAEQAAACVWPGAIEATPEIRCKSRHFGGGIQRYRKPLANRSTEELAHEGPAVGFTLVQAIDELINQSAVEGFESAVWWRQQQR